MGKQTKLEFYGLQSSETPLDCFMHPNYCFCAATTLIIIAQFLLQSKPLHSQLNNTENNQVELCY